MRLLAAVVLAVTLAVTGAGLTGCTEGKPREPVLAGDLVAGGAYDAAAHRGKVTVVNFWGSWCAPCRDEMPGLVRAYEQLKADDVAFLGVNVRDPDVDKATAFVDRFKVPFPSIRDPQSRLALEFDVAPTTIPATLVLDRDGRPATTFPKAVLEAELVAAVRQVLAGG